MAIVVVLKRSFRSSMNAIIPGWLIILGLDDLFIEKFLASRILAYPVLFVEKTNLGYYSFTIILLIGLVFSIIVTVHSFSRSRHDERRADITVK